MGKDSSVKHLMNACPSCGEVMDVSLCDPYSKVICPECSTAIRVRADFLNFRIKKISSEGMQIEYETYLDELKATELFKALYSTIT